MVCRKEHEWRVSLRSDCHVHEIESFAARHLFRVGVDLGYTEFLRERCGLGVIAVAQRDQPGPRHLLPGSNLKLPPEAGADDREGQLSHKSPPTKIPIDGAAVASLRGCLCRSDPGPTVTETFPSRSVRERSVVCDKFVGNDSPDDGARKGPEPFFDGASPQAVLTPGLSDFHALQA